MKPIIITLLAMPIVGTLHHYSQPPKVSGDRGIVSNSKTVSQIQPVKTTLASVLTILPTKAPIATPAPVVTPTPTYPSGCSNYESMFSQYDWNVKIAMAICQAESSGDPYNISVPDSDGLRDYGLMQLHGVDILNPEDNIAYAYYHKYLTQGWTAWSTYKSGIYLKYL